jgi:hypothetical protein
LSSVGVELLRRRLVSAGLTLCLNVNGRPPLGGACPRAVAQDDGRAAAEDRDLDASPSLHPLLLFGVALSRALSYNLARSD